MVVGLAGREAEGWMTVRVTVLTFGGGRATTALPLPLVESVARSLLGAKVEFGAVRGEGGRRGRGERPAGGSVEGVLVGVQEELLLLRILEPLCRPSFRLGGARRVRRWLDLDRYDGEGELLRHVPLTASGEE